MVSWQMTEVGGWAPENPTSSFVFVLRITTVHLAVGKPPPHWTVTLQYAIETFFWNKIENKKLRALLLCCKKLIVYGNFTEAV